MVTAPPMDETAGLAVLHGIHSGAYRPIGITPRTIRVEAEVLVKADLGRLTVYHRLRWYQDHLVLVEDAPSPWRPIWTLGGS